MSLQMESPFALAPAEAWMFIELPDEKVIKCRKYFMNQMRIERHGSRYKSLEYNAVEKYKKHKIYNIKKKCNNIHLDSVGTLMVPSKVFSVRFNDDIKYIEPINRTYSCECEIETQHDNGNDFDFDFETPYANSPCTSRENSLDKNNSYEDCICMISCVTP